jgi:predicted nucleotidyltransferase
VQTLEAELRELVRLFNQKKIEYALCGGMAVAIHGYPRFTKDIDFLVPAESLERAREVAAMAGFLDESGRIPFADSDVYRVIKTDGTNFRILDFLVPKRLDTIAWQQRQWFDWDGLPLCTVSVDGLIEMKRAAGRDIDLIDIKRLGFDPDERK